jgi:hypothetical protein
MLFSTLLTFFVVPAMYILLEHGRERVLGRRPLVAEVTATRAPAES